MRNSVRNQTLVWYALRNVSAEKDEWGNAKNVATYSQPMGYKISLSANRGEASAQTFGADLRYDREMVTHDMSCPIDEYSRLWIDEAPTESVTQPPVWTDGDTIFINTMGVAIGTNTEGMTFADIRPHNYEVAAVSRSLNCIRYAIRRVNVSE
jgi:hypothetical protein